MSGNQSVAVIFAPTGSGSVAGSMVEQVSSLIDNVDLSAFDSVSEFISYSVRNEDKIFHRLVIHEFAFDPSGDRQKVLTQDADVHDDNRVRVLQELSSYRRDGRDFVEVVIICRKEFNSGVAFKAKEILDSEIVVPVFRDRLSADYLKSFISTVIHNLVETVPDAPADSDDDSAPVESRALAVSQKSKPKKRGLFGRKRKGADPEPEPEPEPEPVSDSLDDVGDSSISDSGLLPDSFVGSGVGAGAVSSVSVEGGLMSGVPLGSFDGVIDEFDSETNFVGDDFASEDESVPAPVSAEDEFDVSQMVIPESSYGFSEPEPEPSFEDSTPEPAFDSAGWSDSFEDTPPTPPVTTATFAVPTLPASAPPASTSAPAVPSYTPPASTVSAPVHVEGKERISVFAGEELDEVVEYASLLALRSAEFAKVLVVDVVAGTPAVLNVLNEPVELASGVHCAGSGSVFTESDIDFLSAGSDGSVFDWLADVANYAEYTKVIIVSDLASVPLLGSLLNQCVVHFFVRGSVRALSSFADVTTSGGYRDVDVASALDSRSQVYVSHVFEDTSNAIDFVVDNSVFDRVNLLSKIG